MTVQESLAQLKGELDKPADERDWHWVEAAFHAYVWVPFTPGQIQGLAMELRRTCVNYEFEATRQAIATVIDVADSLIPVMDK